ncbi:MAG: PASTA domain-containing protein, partial [Muribaculaceae bacterium]|nr:PASTA domain-containing protein [Muribaculaceae bacterium]
KLYARGYLDNYADLSENAPENPGKPTLYSTFLKDRSLNIHDYIDMQSASVIASPKATPAGTVPDVLGLGVREAVVRLEEAGYNVAFDGVGYVTAQTPAAGTKYKSGSIVTVSLKQF